VTKFVFAQDSSLGAFGQFLSKRALTRAGQAGHQNDHNSGNRNESELEQATGKG